MGEEAARLIAMFLGVIGAVLIPSGVILFLFESSSDHWLRPIALVVIGVVVFIGAGLLRVGRRSDEQIN